MKSGSPMKRNFGIGESPAKHTKSRGDHMKNFGEGHTNEDHPDYWKKNPEVREEGEFDETSKDTDWIKDSIEEWKRVSKKRDEEKKSPTQMKSPVKHSGAEFNEAAKAESPSGRGVSEKDQIAHDKGHKNLWDENHNPKEQTVDVKEGSAADKKTKEA